MNVNLFIQLAFSKTKRTGNGTFDKCVILHFKTGEQKG